MYVTWLNNVTYVTRKCYNTTFVSLVTDLAKQVKLQNLPPQGFLLQLNN